MKYELLRYYDDIRRLAESKCASMQDAEDLVSETFLAAYSYLQRGGTIEHPKTWLCHTFYHKLNSALRRKYSGMVTVGLDAVEELAEEEEEDRSEEAAEVRRELLYLSRTTREVLIRYYYNGSSVADIAAQLNIPEGTVKSRLSAGREKIKKGLTHMTDQKYHIPGLLNVSYSGSDGKNGHPMNLLKTDKIAQNLLYLAYKKPVTVTELAESIGIPTVYVEPILEKLVDWEFVVKTDGGKYYTDFLIFMPEDMTGHFEEQRQFTRERFDRIWTILADMIEHLHTLDAVKPLGERQRMKLERYAVLRALQRFQLEPAGGTQIKYPNRKDGGRWIAIGRYYPGGYDSAADWEKKNYEINGGHRTSNSDGAKAGLKRLELREFDTFLWDNPNRWLQTCGYDIYFKEMRFFLWYLYRGIPLEESGISNTMIESIDRLIEHTGLIVRENGRLQVDIPVFSRKEYLEVDAIIDSAYRKLIDEIGEEYKSFIRGNMLELPPHLKNVPDVLRYQTANNYIVMSVVRDAYEKGLHMAGVDYVCPPCVLIYEE